MSSPGLLGAKRSSRNHRLQLAASTTQRLTCAAFDDESDETPLITCTLCGAFCASSIFMYHDASYCTASCRRHAMQPPTFSLASDEADCLSDF
jgi:hypothetical protein